MFINLVKVKVTNEWKEKVTGLGLKIGRRNYSMNDAQAPIFTHVRPGEARLWLLPASAESSKTYGLPQIPHL